MKHLKKFDGFLNESNNPEEDSLKMELEKAYRKKVKDIKTTSDEGFCSISVTFVDGLEGHYEAEEEVYNLNGYIEIGGKQIAEDEGTPEQEEVRSILVDFVESNFE